MTTEQKTMQDNAPETATGVKKYFTKKNMLIGAGIAVGVTAAVFAGPKVLTKVKHIKEAKSAAETLLKVV